MDVFGALASYHRRKILSLLRVEVELPAAYFIDTLGLSQPGVSKHLKCLLDSGLIRARGGLHRRIYRIDPVRLAEVDAWLDELQPLSSAGSLSESRAVVRH